MASQRVEANTVLCLDLSDIRKEYAQKMEHLASVRDGSTGEVHAGYWLCAITGAEVNGSEIIPLFQKLYSTEAPEFLSENAEVLAGVDLLRAHTQGRGIWAWIEAVTERNGWNPGWSGGSALSSAPQGSVS